MLRRLPATVLRRARWASVRWSRSGRRHQPVGSASASRLSAATRSSAGRSGLDQQPVHVRLAGPDVAAEQHPQRGGRVVDVDLAGVGRGPVAEDAPRPVGQHDRQPARRGSAGRRPSMTRRAVSSTIRPGSRAVRRAVDPAAHRAASPGAHHAAPWRKNGAPRSHSRRACQWIRPIVLLGHQRVRAGASGAGRGRSSRQAPQDQARAEQRLAVLAHVDRDAQAGRLVPDVHR